MKKKIIKIISEILSAIILLVFLYSAFVFCKLHIFSTMHLECSQCLIEYSVKNITKRMHIAKIAKMLSLFIMYFCFENQLKNFIICNDPFLMKVKLNE